MSSRDEIRQWWADNPMTYGRTHGRAEYTEGSYQEGTGAFFDRVDAKLHSWNAPLHSVRPFDRLFPYGRYGRGSHVLEVGCGLGTMAMSWALNGADVVAVDLNPVAVQQTRTRFRLHDLDARAVQADGKRLPFPDASFDYVYSWGALHHSPGLGWSVAELVRVAKPGAGFGVMLYNRRSIHHWYMTRFVEGFLHYESRFLGPLRLASRYGDGAREEGNPYTWPVTRDEILALVRPYSDDAQVRVLGTDLDGIFTLMLPGLGLVMPPSMKKVWARRLGWSLWTAGHLR